MIDLKRDGGTEPLSKNIGVGAKGATPPPLLPAPICICYLFISLLLM